MALDQLLQTIVIDFKKSMSEFAQKLPPSLNLLAEHGWYVCGNSPMTDGVELAQQLRKGNKDKVDKYLMEFYDGEFRSIINSLMKAFPERVNLLKEVQLAHQREMYYSSTALLLATADGIFNGELFSKAKKGKPNLIKQIKVGRRNSEYGEILTKMSAIDVAYQEQKKFQSPLNRHGVMHGLDFKYGTKINSLKALSLVAFIADLVKR